MCCFVQGYFPSTLTDEHRDRVYSVASLDCDLHQPMKAALQYFYLRMSLGGILLLHDYSSKQWLDAKKAIDDFV